jgi:ribonuclease VapC
MPSTTSTVCLAEAPRMVVDTSALVAILKVEPDAAELLVCLSQASSAVISTATLLEAQMVVCSHLGDDVGLPELELLLGRTDVQPVAFESSHLHWALQGWRRYGKGRHRAALNLGDCFSYGLAMALDLPLLFKGDDFALTDVKLAL